MKQLQAHTFSGSDAEAGSRHAEHAKAFVDADLAALAPLWDSAKESPHYKAMFRYMRSLHPNLMAEAEAFAEGLKLPVEEALFPTLAPAFDPELEKVQNTVVLWRHKREGPVLFRTEDGSPLAVDGDPEKLGSERLERLAMVEHQGSRTLRSLSLWRLGRFGMQAGINEAGLLIGYSVGRPCLAEVREGLPYPLLAMMVLRTCRNADDVYHLVKHTPLVGNGANILFSDADGQLCNVEQTGEFTNIRNGGDYQVAVNHQHDEANREMIRRVDETWLDSAEYLSSRQRAQFIEDRMLYVGSRYRLAAREQLQKLIEHRSGAICQHGTGTNNHRTDYAVLITAGTGEMDIFAGPPCEGDVRTFQVPWHPEAEHAKGALVDALKS